MTDPEREGEGSPTGIESSDLNPVSSDETSPESNGRDRSSEDRPASLGEALDRIDSLRAELDERDARLKAADDRYLRERADLENFKRRMQRERAEGLRYASEGLIRELLPVVDNLERAVRAARESQTADAISEALVSGVEMILRQLGETLERAGATRIATVGQAFDPALHEALAQVEHPVLPPGTVVEELRSGYRLHDRLLRAAQVSVAKAPSAGEN